MEEYDVDTSSSCSFERDGMDFSEQYQRKDAPYVPVQTEKRYDWKFIYEEVIWYLTTDGTGVLPVLCCLFFVVPIAVVFLLGRLWRLLKAESANSQWDD
jgi:hypothetical protein